MPVPGSGDPSGTLIVSGGGSTMVATDELLAEVANLRTVQHDAADWRCRLSRIRLLDDTPAPSWRPGDAAIAIFNAEQTAVLAEEHSLRLANSLSEAAENYGNAERMLEVLLRSSSAFTAHTVGRFVPLLAVMALPVATSAMLISRVLSQLFPGASGVPGSPGAQTDGARNDRLAAHLDVLRDPVFVHAVRVLVSAVDDGAAGAAGVPLPVSLMLGDDGLGMLGVSMSALGMLGLARPMGGLQETAVRVRRTAITRATPPRGLAELAERIPGASPGASQVRIERYGTVRPVWVVYAGGTIAWSPAASREPWDLTSNVASVAGRESGSYRTVVQAMKAAGVRPGDRVVQVGHSQGGLVAAQIAASGEFRTVAVATFGAPAGQVSVAPDVPMIATEHTDDLVPALGGTPRDDTGPGNQHLVVRRQAFATDDVPAGEYLPAHGLGAYEETARIEDASAEPRIAAFRGDLAGLVGDEPGEVSMWRGIRVGKTGDAASTADE